MKSLSKGALALAVVCVCLSFALLAPAAPQDANPKKTAQKAKTSPSTKNFAEKDLKVLKPLPDMKPIAFTSTKLGEVREFWNDKTLTLTSKLNWTTKEGKKVTIAVKDYMAQLDKAEKWLNAHGYTIRNKLADYPKGGLKLGVPSKGPVGGFAKQKADIAAVHAKPSAAQQKLAKAFDAAKQKETAATDKKRQDLLASFREGVIDKGFKAIKNPTAAQKKAHEEFKATKKITPQDLPPGIHPIEAKHVLVGTEYHKNQTWSVGSADIAEVDLVADLDITTQYDLVTNSTQLHARGSLEANCFILDGSRSSPINFVDVVADITTGSPQSQFQAHAKVVGIDLFPPVNQKFNTNGTPLTKSVDPSFNQTLAQGVIGAFGFGINYSVNLKGDLKYSLTAQAFPTELIVTPVIAVNSSLSATAGVDAGIASVGVRGTLNLINDTLTLNSKAGIVSDGKTAFFDTFGSAQNTFGTLGGEIDLVATVHLGPLGDHDLGSITLLSVPDQITTSGFLFGPDESKQPLFPLTGNK